MKQDRIRPSRIQVQVGAFQDEQENTITSTFEMAQRKS